MLEITYVKLIPYSFDIVLAQYYDYEHIAHVHPETLGEYRLVESTEDGVVYEQHWPADWRGQRAVSRVKQTFQAPDTTWFEFTAGKHRGTKVRSQLRAEGDSTEVTETYFIPGLPNWTILRRLLRPFVIQQVDRVWHEDLSVGVCIGGWPGVPGNCDQQTDPVHTEPLSPGQYELGPLDQYPLHKPVRKELAAGSVLVLRTDNGIRALHPICPHTGGPMELGEFAEDCLICPWHGAKFNTQTGTAVSGPTNQPLPVYETSVTENKLTITVSPSPDNA